MKWPFSRSRRARKAPRLVRPTLEPLEGRWLPAVDVTNFHYDTASTGANDNETQLTPANVRVGSFGKEFSTAVDGQVYAQPLVVNGVTIAAGPNTTPGAAGTYNVAFVATENDSLYAIDTNPADNGAVLWKRSFLDASDPNDALPGATAVAPMPYTDVGINDISPTIGITGTPVIDPATNVLYLVTKTSETVDSQVHWVQRLHAINLADGTDAAPAFVIGDTTNDPGTGDAVNDTPVYVYGTGDGNVPDPYNNTGRPVVQFNALTANQRAALSLVNGTVYVSWASHGDAGPYHGWVATFDVSGVANQGNIRLSGVLNVTPNGGGGGIWMSGGQLVFEPDGSAFYLETGNGNADDNPALDANGFPVNGDYNESLLKVVADPTTTATRQNVNGWGMKVADYFTPSNRPQLDQNDMDFGSGAPLLLPPEAGIPGHPNLLIASGKEGRIYVLDRNNLGKYNPAGDAALNAVPDGSGHTTPPVQLSGGLSTPAYDNGTLYYVSGYNGPAYSFTLNPDGSLSPTSQSPEADFGYLPGSPVVTSNNGLDGIVWQVDTGANELHAYDAASLADELWNSNMNPTGADALGAAVKFAAPTVADGEVFVGTTSALVVYGLTPPATAAPSAPSLSASALSDTSVRLTWTDPTPSPNTAGGYLVEQSSDGGRTFTQVTTAAAGATALDIGGLTANTSYVFRVRGFNGVGDSGYSNTATVVTTATGAQAPLAPTGLGAAPASGTAVRLSWTANSHNEDGYYLDRANNADFTSNLITQALPASATTFTDTASGLAPGGTYYYRLRAFNAAGVSASTPPAAVSIPLAPARPSNAQVVRATPTEVDLQWTDNAGRTAQGYLILRSANHGSYTVVANLPARNAVTPGPYAWSDTTVSPNTYYEYHIEAYNISGHNDFTGTNVTTPGVPSSPSAAPPPSSSQGPTAYRAHYGPLLDLRVQPLRPDGTPFGPEVDIPFPLSFFGVSGLSAGPGGGVTVDVQIFFLRLALEYSASGALIGIGL